MDEAMLCERIALIQNGEIMSINTPERIISEYPKKLYAIKSKNMSHLLQDIRQFDGIESCNSFGENHHISFNDEDDLENQQRLIAYLHAKNHQQIEFKPVRPTIEDCFIKLMN
jgi:ABC-type multidrug transport system ATPase subunit